MTGFDFLILFGLICMMCPCQGKINLPPNGDKLVFAKGTTAKIDWSFSKDVDISMLLLRTWNFKSDVVSSKLIASISKDDDPDIKNVLPGVSIDKPTTLILKDVDHRYEGEYTFSISGNIPDASKVAVVIAEKPIVKVNCSGTTTIDEGDYFACQCRGEGGNPKPANVTWYDNKQAQIGEAENEEKILTLSSVKRTESGSYKCVAKTHELTKNETSIQLIVNFKPDITSLTSSPPKPAVGQKVTITCVADARPEPSYSIIYNGTKVSDDNTYTISKVGQDDAGTYVCNATNPLGSDSKSFSLIVGQSPTTIPTSKGNETVAEDEGDGGGGGLGGGAIAGIVIGVLVVVVIVAGVIYWFKFKPNGKDHGSRKDTEEKAKKKRGDENVYDAVNMDDKASGSRSSHELESPMNYAVLDKNALNTGAPKKPERDAEESTAYASIDVGKVGQVEADLV